MATQHPGRAAVFQRPVRRAVDDLAGIGRYIAADNPKAAAKLVARLRLGARNALGSPLANRMVPELSREDVREVLDGNYRVVYQVFPDRLVVLTVFEGHKLFRP